MDQLIEYDIRTIPAKSPYICLTTGSRDCIMMQSVYSAHWAHNTEQDGLYSGISCKAEWSRSWYNVPNDGAVK